MVTAVVTNNVLKLSRDIFFYIIVLDARHFDRKRVHAWALGSHPQPVDTARSAGQENKHIPGVPVRAPTDMYMYAVHVHQRAR